MYIYRARNGEDKYRRSRIFGSELRHNDVRPQVLSFSKRRLSYKGRRFLSHDIESASRNSTPTTNYLLQLAQILREVMEQRF